MHRVLLCIAFVLPCLLPGVALGAPDEDEVVLRDGVKLHGRVVDRENVRGRRMARIETDFGVFRIDTNLIRRALEDEPTPGVFFFQRIRVARVVGTVEKRTAGSNAWVPVRLEDDYGPILNAPDAIVAPGDTVRTDFGSHLELMPHRGVWLRIEPNSEVEFPAERGPASIVLKKGRTLQRIDGKPRGKTFVIQTPSRLLTVGGTEFLVEVGEQERIAVTQGEVEVEGGSAIRAGRSGRWSGGGDVQEGKIDPGDVRTLSVEGIRLPAEDMVYIPKGKYQMGGRGEEDAPKRHVTLSGYLIDRREVSNAEFATYAKATGAGVPAYFVGGKPPPGEERHPVHNLTAAMARGYAAWAGRKLPTEAQWEAAARGPKALAFPWGRRPPKAGELPHVEVGNLVEAKVGELRPVDAETTDVSPFGLLGMLSSVPEWCRDWYADDFYARGQDENPQGPSAGLWRVARGHWPFQGTDPRPPSVTARLRTAEGDEKAGTGARGVIEPE